MCRVVGARTRARWRHGFDCAPKQQARLPGVRRSPRPDLQHPHSLLGQLSLALLVGTAAARRQVLSVTTGRSGTGPLTTSAQRADWAHSSLPHLYRDRAPRSHICSREWAHPGPHLQQGLDSPLPTSAPGLGHAGSARAQVQQTLTLRVHTQLGEGVRPSAWGCRMRQVCV